MTTAKRIALLHYAAPPVIGGVEAVMAKHARLLAEHGYAPKIITGRGEPFDPRVEMHVNPLFDSRHAEVVAVQSELARGEVNGTFRALVTQMREALAEALADCDVCIAHNVVTLHKNMALTVALKELSDAGRMRLIAWCHDFAWADPLYLPQLHEGWSWDLLRRAWKNVRYVVVSQARRELLAELLELPQSDIRVITAGIEPEEFFGFGADVRQWAAQFDWWHADPLMLLPARVTRRKNIELGIEITAALKARGLSPQLVVMGPLGPHNPTNVAYLQSLRELSEARGVRDAVIFLQEHGSVSDEARRDLYLIADLLLFPSSQEGFGIPILEGGLARLPIFCSDIPPFRESAGEDAHFFQLNENPSHIATRMINSLNADRSYQLRRRVLHDFDWQHIWAHEIEPLLEEVMHAANV